MELADILDTVVHGNALEVLRSLPDNSLDALCADPPAGINFMNKKFDEDKGGREQWIAWLSEIMKEALRVLKPGAHALIWSLPRTSHWTATALEEAGFEIRDNLYHVYASDAPLQAFLESLTESQQEAFAQLLESQGENSFLLHIFGTGFPKNLAIDYAIDKYLGKTSEREILRQGPTLTTGNTYGEHLNANYLPRAITAPATPEASQWHGFGTALKPACETWWLCRKPLAEKSIAKNVLAYGTGGINIDASRVGTEQTTTTIKDLSQAHGNQFGKPNIEYPPLGHKLNPPGRWPANFLLSHTIFCERVGVKRIKIGGGQPTQGNARNGGNVYDGLVKTNSSTYHGDEDGMEEVEEWHCVEGCPVAELDRQSGTRKSGMMKPGQQRNASLGKGGYHDNFPSIATLQGTYGDQGGASRYFQQFPGSSVPFYYAPKASRKERNNGCEALPHRSPGEVTGRKDGSAGLNNPRAGAGRTSGNQNTHPTVKSQALMQYLLRLITPPQGIVLDCFAGSGSTGVAAVAEGFHFILIEQLDTPEEPYCTIARSRIAQAIREREEHS